MDLPFETRGKNESERWRFYHGDFPTVLAPAPNKRRWRGNAKPTGLPMTPSLERTAPTPAPSKLFADLSRVGNAARLIFHAPMTALPLVKAQTRRRE
jgi:hypothetical protein